MKLPQEGSTHSRQQAGSLVMASLVHSTPKVCMPSEYSAPPGSGVSMSLTWLPGSAVSWGEQGSGGMLG